MRQESSPPYLPPEPSVSFIHSRLIRRKETEAGTEEVASGTQLRGDQEIG